MIRNMKIDYRKISAYSKFVLFAFIYLKLDKKYRRSHST